MGYRGVLNVPEWLLREVDLGLDQGPFGARQGLVQVGNAAGGRRRHAGANAQLRCLWRFLGRGLLFFKFFPPREPVPPGLVMHLFEFWQILTFVHVRATSPVLVRPACNKTSNHGVVILVVVGTIVSVYLLSLQSSGEKYKLNVMNE